jgi:Tfp pilus assembly protein PilX
MFPMNPGHPRSSEKGIALAASLLALSMLTLIGLSMTFVSSTEVLVNQNNKMRLVNLYLAESATEEARDRIRDLIASNQLSLSDATKVVYIVADSSINPTTGNADSNPYFDPEYSSSLSVSIINSDLGAIGFAWVKIWQKTEARAAYSLTNSSGNTTDPVFYGFDRIQPNAQLTQYVSAGSNVANHTGSPVYLVTALARNSSGYRQRVATDIAALPSPPMNAALFSKDAIQVLGSGVVVEGNDQSAGTPVPLNGLESVSTITGDLAGVTGTPLPDRPLSSYSYNMSSLLKSLKPPFTKDIEQIVPGITILSDGTYVGSGLSLGQVPTSGDISQSTYVDGPLNISDSSGQGILVINGDLSVTGSFTFFGLIIVKGKIHLNGGGMEGIRIHGAVIASSDLGDAQSVLDGIVQIRNDSAMIQAQFNRLQYARLAFREM